MYDSEAVACAYNGGAGEASTAGEFNASPLLSSESAAALRSTAERNLRIQALAERGAKLEQQLLEAQAHLDDTRKRCAQRLMQQQFQKHHEENPQTPEVQWQQELHTEPDAPWSQEPQTEPEVQWQQRQQLHSQPEVPVESAILLTTQQLPRRPPLKPCCTDAPAAEKPAPSCQDQCFDEPGLGEIEFEGHRQCVGDAPRSRNRGRGLHKGGVQAPSQQLPKQLQDLKGAIGAVQKQELLLRDYINRMPVLQNRLEDAVKRFERFAGSMNEGSLEAKYAEMEHLRRDRQALRDAFEDFPELPADLSLEAIANLGAQASSASQRRQHAVARAGPPARDCHPALLARSNVSCPELPAAEMNSQVPIGTSANGVWVPELAADEVSATEHCVADAAAEVDNGHITTQHRQEPAVTACSAPAAPAVSATQIVVPTAPALRRTSGLSTAGLRPECFPSPGRAARAPRTQADTVSMLKQHKAVPPVHHGAVDSPRRCSSEGATALSPRSASLTSPASPLSQVLSPHGTPRVSPVLARCSSAGPGLLLMPPERNLSPQLAPVIPTPRAGVVFASPASPAVHNCYPVSPQPTLYRSVG
eukprot:gnl/TRDRNA2_/TRDRNA2_83337_c0_seq1.p1 gnl/TRDRNA2_/TRDRNA2_83337_c0~~gnl/TRDRNA2_/TRDRNA2_83337_c0_seq1.p1  ORF type:complete len:643 (+),score=129.47 gnl/TRDRNA2_/TRDRNA2_83337_c0_seq1:164-1930(+)